jgi:hypothetical protein
LRRPEKADVELIEAFLDHFSPLFNPENVEPSPIGRALPVQASLHNRPIGEIVYELTGYIRVHDGIRAEPGAGGPESAESRRPRVASETPESTSGGGARTAFADTLAFSRK